MCSAGAETKKTPENAQKKGGKNAEIFADSIVEKSNEMKTE